MSLPRAVADVEPYWLAVVNVNQDLELSNRSMRCGLAANWCLAAPGSNINSTVYGPDSVIEGDFYDDNGNLVVDIISQTPSSDYEELSGTSMAARTSPARWACCSSASRTWTARRCATCADHRHRPGCCRRGRCLAGA